MVAFLAISAALNEFFTVHPCVLLFKDYLKIDRCPL